MYRVMECEKPFGEKIFGTRRRRISSYMSTQKTDIFPAVNTFSCKENPVIVHRS